MYWDKKYSDIMKNRYGSFKALLKFNFTLVTILTNFGNICQRVFYISGGEVYWGLIFFPTISFINSINWLRGFYYHMPYIVYTFHG